MGVKDLWNIISPSSERRPLYELQGKVIAIDLSGWIVDSQSVTDNVIQPKMYLRLVDSISFYVCRYLKYFIFILHLQ